LPAALQARDVSMGVRMGAERELKITRLVEKLNRIIHRSGLVTRFISMVFGELELNGNFMYVNAGHPPALLLDGNGLRELAVGGPLLGPIPDANYKMGFAHIDRGAALAMVSDGVLECRDREGIEFGAERLASWLTDSRDRDAETSIADLVDRLRRHYGVKRPFEDDVTVMLARRLRA
jgi:sigma-B regulation protein RsbU (phosphoserine phosphatase)